MFMKHKPGGLAYFDSCLGLIPCRVLSVKNSFIYGAIPAKLISIELTANRGCYKKGETLERACHSMVVPLANVKQRKYGPSIVGRWEWLADS